MDRLGFIGIIKSYFIIPQSGFPLVNPGWSLEHEILFYLLAAIVVPFFKLRGLFMHLLSYGYARYFTTDGITTYSHTRNFILL